MAIAYVQSTSNNTGTPGTSATAALTVTSGNLLTVGLATSGAGTSVTGVTDTAGNTYTRRTGREFRTGAGGTEIWSAIANGSGSVTVTAAFSGNVSFAIAFMEHSGVDQSSPFDVENSDNGNSTTPSSGTATTTVADEVLIGIISYAGTLTFDAPWNSRQTTGFPFQFADRIVTATGSYAASGTLAVANNWTACMATFKQAAVAGGQPTMRRWGAVLYLGGRPYGAGKGGRMWGRTRSGLIVPRRFQEAA